MNLSPAPEIAEHAWLARVRQHVLRGELSAAQAALAQALAEYPASPELRRAQAGIMQQTGRTAEAEAMLRELLAHDPDDVAAGFALARMLHGQTRNAAAAEVLRGCCTNARRPLDAGLAIDAIELLDACVRKRDAFAIAESALASSPDDPRLHAYAGMLAMQLGEFERARRHYLFALEHDARAFEWHVPIGLASAQRYADAGHPDFALFRSGLARTDLSALARAELHFALGKAHDGAGEYAQAAQHFRQGNMLRHRTTPWSRKAWRRAVETRLASRPGRATAPTTAGFTPVFIVGMPRTGTTLLAAKLSRYPETCNRGELPVLAQLATQPALSGTPDGDALRRAAAHYAQQARQDDAREARWFIDKQPLNFRYVDLALAMFPDAKIIHCRRAPRDTALSLWTQCFLEDVQGYAYDFDDIALVLRDCERLMAHWQALHPDSIRAVRYEQLVASPQATVAELADWIGLPPLAADATNNNAGTAQDAISTASLWQARQPVNTRSVGRWKAYAACLPELLQFPDA